MNAAKITFEITKEEREALREFLARDFGITRNLTQYPTTTALIKLQKEVNE